MITNIKAEAAHRAMKLLDASGFQYAVLMDGEKFGALEIMESNNRPGWVRYSRGMTRRHYWPYLQDMQPGDVAEIPQGGFNMATLASNISAACCHTWGNGSAICQRDEANAVVTVLRVS
jgi:hypothetical protein